MHPDAGAVEATFETHTSWVYSVCCMSRFTHANGAESALVASGSRDTTVRVYAGFAHGAEHGASGPQAAAAREWQEIFVFEGHSDWVAHVKWSHCGKLLLSCCNDGTLRCVSSHVRARSWATVCVCVYVYTCVCVYVRMCVCACV